MPPTIKSKLPPETISSRRAATVACSKRRSRR